MNLNEMIKNALGTKEVSSYAKLGQAMVSHSMIDKAQRGTAQSITQRVLTLAKQVIKGAESIDAPDRKAFLNSEMKAIHAKAVTNWVKEYEVDIAELAWPKPRLVEGERKRGLQNKMSFISLTAPELDAEPTVDLIVSGSGWKSTVSDIGKLWFLTDSETVQAITQMDKKDDPIQGLKQAIAHATPEPEKTDKTDQEANDQSNLYEVIGKAFAGYDLTGNTLDAATLLAFQETLATTLGDALNLPKKTG